MYILHLPMFSQTLMMKILNLHDTEQSLEYYQYQLLIPKRRKKNFLTSKHQTNLADTQHQVQETGIFWPQQTFQWFRSNSSGRHSSVKNEADAGQHD